MFHFLLRARNVINSMFNFNPNILFIAYNDMAHILFEFKMLF